MRCRDTARRVMHETRGTCVRCPSDIASSFVRGATARSTQQSCTLGRQEGRAEYRGVDEEVGEQDRKGVFLVSEAEAKTRSAPSCVSERERDGAKVSERLQGGVGGGLGYHVR